MFPPQYIILSQRLLDLHPLTSPHAIAQLDHEFFATSWISTSLHGPVALAWSVLLAVVYEYKEEKQKLQVTFVSGRRMGIGRTACAATRNSDSHACIMLMRHMYVLVQNLMDEKEAFEER